jgi:hypothetical protein
MGWQRPPRQVGRSVLLFVSKPACSLAFSSRCYRLFLGLFRLSQAFRFPLLAGISCRVGTNRWRIAEVRGLLRLASCRPSTEASRDAEAPSAYNWAPIPSTRASIQSRNTSVGVGETATRRLANPSICFTKLPPPLTPSFAPQPACPGRASVRLKHS